ncbi:MAG: SAM-dependent methyltransferase, partial [Gammaproteobacteria bacterium]|nr:SAM-dependent methyltransferase [Gammaproteobacteria bacterium]
RNPITPTLITFLAQYHGFTNIEIRRLHPYPESAKVPGHDPLTERVNGHLCGPQDFALLAYRPQPV